MPDFLARERDAYRYRTKATRRLYNTARWARIRRAQLFNKPLCRACQAQGKIKPGTECDHITPHNDDPALFWVGPFQSLCKQCHQDKTTREQGRTPRPRPRIGLDGWPMGT